MTSITSFADYFVVRIVAHEYAKHRRDVPTKPDAEGNVALIPNKKKFVRTAAALSSQYGLLVEPKLIKANKVSTSGICTVFARCVCDWL